MSQPWRTLARVDTAEGPLELRQRGEKDFLITVAGRVLMTSAARRSEEALSTIALRALVRPRRVLIGGLGMAYTLRAALDELPGDAAVTVAELTAEVADWCRGPLAVLTDGAASDPRVSVVVDDVAHVIARARGLDAILLDLYEGPYAATQAKDHPIYGVAALRRAWEALNPGGVLAVWAEDPDASFPKRLEKAGFAASTHRAGKGGRSHIVYLARK